MAFVEKSNQALESLFFLKLKKREGQCSFHTLPPIDRWNIVIYLRSVFSAEWKTGFSGAPSGAFSQILVHRICARTRAQRKSAWLAWPRLPERKREEKVPLLKWIKKGVKRTQSKNWWHHNVVEYQNYMWLKYQYFKLHFSIFKSLSKEKSDFFPLWFSCFDVPCFACAHR